MSVLSTKWKGLAANLFFDNWPLLLIHRLLFRGMPLVVYRKKQLTFVVDFAGGDENGTRSCLTSDMYKRFFKHLESSRPMTLLDLGANGGGLALALCANGFIIQKAACVEMNCQTYTRLCFNLAYNHIPAVPVNAAVAAKNGSLELPDSPGNTGGSMYQRSDSQTRTVTVSLLTFDSIVHAHFANHDDILDLVKMDVEGAEYEILLSDSCGSLRRFKHLLMEIHPNPSTPVGELLTRIRSLGFSPVGDRPVPDDGVYFFQNMKLPQ
jgi:FkbM family methyltransferase